MRSLRVVELAPDGQALILAHDVPPGIENGERYTLPIDDRLRVATQVDSKRLQLSEIDPAADPLSPREIQTRIRTGQSVAQVAAESGMRAEHIERYAYPVLQERSRVAEQARTARVRLRIGQPSAPLAEFVGERLAVIGATSAVAWDACRSGNSWEIRLSWRADHKFGSMVWAYDPATRSVTPLDSETSEFAEGRPADGLRRERTSLPTLSPPGED